MAKEVYGEASRGCGGMLLNVNNVLLGSEGALKMAEALKSRRRVE